MSTAHFDGPVHAGREVLREAATTVMDSLFPVEAVQAHLEGLRGWARIADRLPSPGDRDGDIARRAWRLVDELIFRLERADLAAEDEVTRCWQELHGPCAQATVDVRDAINPRSGTRTPDASSTQRAWADNSLLSASPWAPLHQIQRLIVSTREFPDASGPMAPRLYTRRSAQQNEPASPVPR